jgi:hypothetical protein
VEKHDIGHSVVLPRSANKCSGGDELESLFRSPLGELLVLLRHLNGLGDRCSYCCAPRFLVRVYRVSDFYNEYAQNLLVPPPNFLPQNTHSLTRMNHNLKEVPSMNELVLSAI